MGNENKLIKKPVYVAPDVRRKLEELATLNRRSMTAQVAYLIMQEYERTRTRPVEVTGR